MGHSLLPRGAPPTGNKRGSHNFLVPLTSQGGMNTWLPQEARSSKLSQAMPPVAPQRHPWPFCLMVGRSSHPAPASMPSLAHVLSSVCSNTPLEVVFPSLAPALIPPSLTSLHPVLAPIASRLPGFPGMGKRGRDPVGLPLSSLGT